MFESKTYFDSEKKIWSGEKKQLPFNSDISLGELILETLQQNPNKVIQSSANNGIEITNKEMHIMSIRVCQNIQLKGLKQTDVIGLAASNSHYLAPLVFGSFLCGTALSTLDPCFRKDEIKHIYAITKPKLIFCDPENYQAMKDSVAELNLNASIYLLKGNLDGAETIEEFLKSTGTEANFVAPKLKEGGDQTAAILCSSGTTGLPKGVCMSHKMITRHAKFTSLVEHDVLFCYSSLYWLTGLFMLVLGTLNRCLRVIIDEPFSVETFFDIVEKYRVTCTLCPPSQLALITQSDEVNTRDLSSMSRVMCGGSAVPNIIKQRMENYLPNGFVAVAYGMSEIAGCSNIESLKYRCLGSSGQLMPNCEMKIIDEYGNSLGREVKGEICIRTMEKWPGYFGDKNATADIYDKDGWIHSGDLGYFDSCGYLFIVDRKKDILKYKNFHFFPSEIEQIILELSDVIEVSVCGLPDIIYTDLPAALVVKKENSNLKEEDIFKHVEQKLADFKKLRGGVYFVQSLPETASGKVQRNIVKDIVIKLSKINILK